MIAHPNRSMIELLDSILPASLRADTRQWQAARNLTILAAVTALSVPLLTTMYHLLGLDAVGMVVLTAGVVMMVAPFTLAAGLPIAAARDLFVGALFLLKVWMAVHLGGRAGGAVRAGQLRRHQRAADRHHCRRAATHERHRPDGAGRADPGACDRRCRGRPARQMTLGGVFPAKFSHHAHV
jgi:hypothetical protein